MSSTKKYTEDYKRRAVELVLNEGMTASKVAKDLGINPSYLTLWKKEYLNTKHGISNKKPLDKTEADKRITELEKELRIAREERDILKKAVSFFAK